MNFTLALQTWLEATTYLQLVGILIGQLFFGFMGDWVGRKVRDIPVFPNEYYKGWSVYERLHILQFIMQFFDIKEV